MATNQPHQPRAGVPNPNREYWFCRACSWTWVRRTPADPFEDLSTCPNCGKDERSELQRGDGATLLGRDGLPRRALYQAKGHLEVSKWKRANAMQERALPYNAPPNQYLKISARCVDQVFMKVTALEWKLVVFLIRMGNPAQGGWTWPISQQTLSVHLMGRNNNKPLDRSAVKNAIEYLHQLQVNCWNELKREWELRRFLEKTISAPARYRINQP